MKFVIFLLKFDDILSEFREEFQKIAKTLDMLVKLWEKLEKMLEIFGIAAKVHAFSSFVQSSP